MRFFWKVWALLNQQRTFTAKCGHPTGLNGSVTVCGETLPGKLCLNSQGQIPYCHKCLEAMAIPCAWCGKAILVGDPITLYSPRDKSYQPPPGAVVYQQKPLQLVGCIRWDCAETGADRSGFWHPPGQVYRVASALEMVLATNDVVMINNLRDPEEAVPLDD